MVINGLLFMFLVVKFVFWCGRSEVMIKMVFIKKINKWKIVVLMVLGIFLVGFLVLFVVILISFVLENVKFMINMVVKIGNKFFGN